MSAPFILLDPLFGDDDVAAAFERRGAEFGAYRLYSEHEQIQLEIGPDLLPRHDAVRNFLRTRVGTNDTAASVAARTSYFREEYAYGDQLLLDGVEALRDHEGLVAAARAIHGLPIIEPAIVYANLFLPGQELAVHTDVPEFRGMNRKLVPQWLLVVMHHSGLFERWRLPIATGIAWFGAPAGGALVYVARRARGSGAPQPGAAQHGRRPGHRHRVPRGRTGRSGRCRRPTTRRRGRCSALLRTVASSCATPNGRTVRTFGWDELRFSVSWKAYCFANLGDRAAWRDHTDDTDLATVLEALVNDLAKRGHDDVDISSPQLGIRLIDEYVTFPTSPTTAGWS